MKLNKYFACSLLMLATLFTKMEGSEENVSLNISTFLPTDSRFKAIYGNGALIQTEYTRALEGIDLAGNNRLDFFAGLGYLYNSGETNKGSYTHVHYLPMSAGVSLGFLDAESALKPYIGFGPTVVYSNIHNGVDPNSCMKKNQSGFGWGMRAKSGILIRLNEKFKINVFGDYYLTRVFYNHKHCTGLIKYPSYIQGFSLGSGVAYQF